MKFYVPSRSRPDLSTPTVLIGYGVRRSDIKIVIRADEWSLYRERWEPDILTVLPKGIEGLSATRQWLLENTVGKYQCQIDDDITSFAFKDKIQEFGGVHTFVKPAGFSLMMKEFVDWLDDGVVAASTQDRVAVARPSSRRFKDFTRIGQVIFLNRHQILKRDWRFDRCQIYADQDMALQIVRGGGITRVSHEYAHNMRPIYAPGGVQVYRTQRVINASAKKLSDLHPGFVTLKWKQKGKFRVPTRRIAWRKALAESEGL